MTSDEKEFTTYLYGLTLDKARVEALFYYQDAERWRQLAYKLAGQDPETGEFV